MQYLQFAVDHKIKKEMEIKYNVKRQIISTERAPGLSNDLST